MIPRGVLFAAACVLVLADCGTTKRRKRSTTAEAAQAAAGVFESEERYNTQSLDSTELGPFFAKYPEYRPDSAAVADFYERRDWQLAWIIGGSPTTSADAFIAFASTADTTAPGNARFAKHLTELYEQRTSTDSAAPCAECMNDLELHLTAEFFRFAARRYGGYLSRDLAELDWFIPRAKKNAGRLLDSLATGQMDLSAYEPIHPQYQLLKQGIVQYRAAAGTPWPALEFPRAVKKLVPGDSSTLVGDIRRRLIVLGDSSSADAGERYDATMESAVKRFQERHGLNADAVIGTSFLRAVNVPVSARLRTMLVNIERLRWVPEAVPPNLLLVNIPEFRLHVYEGGKEVKTMDVVVGASATSTVIFSDVVSKVVFSPSWTVPSSIVRKEILPAMRKNPGYLDSHEMDIIGGTKSLPEIRQRPGPKNPLGGVKFLFPNSYSIYMHDTPSQATFGRDNRAASHGCVRLSRPAELAEYLLRSDPEWTPNRIQDAMAGGKETFVTLRDQRPVMIGYFTAWVDGNGILNFRDDVYGHDAKLARELFVH